MNTFIIGFIGLAVLLLLFLTGIPISFAMAIVGFIGFAYMVSPDAALSLLARDIFTLFSNYSFTVIPLFILMGCFAFAAGIGGRLYQTVYTIMGHMRGGLAIATIAACAGFGAVCGSTAATCASIGKISIPEMKKHNYSDTLSTGTIASAGSLGILIPPSVTFIVYGILTEQPIGKLFISGIIPGVIISVAFMATVWVVCRYNPASGPRGPKTTWGQKAKSLGGFSDILVLFSLILGGLFAGWFSPTQAGAIGSVGALLIGAARRSLTWRVVWEATKEGIRIACMVMLLITTAIIFGHFLAVTRLPFVMAEYLAALPIHPVVNLCIICMIFFILGCFVDATVLIVILVPIFFPTVLAFGFDPIWFGVLIVILTMIAVVTPPVGVNLYVIKGIAKEVPLLTIFKGILPFLIPFFITLALLIAFPKIATFLPSLITY